MAFHAGRFTLHEIRDGLFRLDGGALFGVVPRVVWQRSFAPDELNRVLLASRCLLIESGMRRILVDTGLGEKLTERQRDRISLDRSQSDLDRELARAGTRREEITDVILSSLHVEHAGGTTRLGPDGAPFLAFPNAAFHLQRRHWRWAHHPSERDRRNFEPLDFSLLESTGRLHLVEGETELFEGVQLCLSEGHTVGMQLVRVLSDNVEVVYCSDLIPTAAHFKPHYQMSTDLYPLTSLEEKKMLLAQAVEDESILFFSHDPHWAGCRVREVEGRVVPGVPVSF